MILNIGNFINQKNRGNTNAYGFKLDSLPLVTKLVPFLVVELRTKYAESLDAITEFECLDQSIKIAKDYNMLNKKQLK
eukprot:UN12207